ncbi:hypothetical protein [uncultured Pelagimonas sp.]|uniref:hypothetical protein n=1 Tax=uncultured Pelagimonas sp. TaxID=1618102 RepID=UPI0026077ADF|nr:hypothetical protein [uncultured Pelagimonas sp.]
MTFDDAQFDAFLADITDPFLTRDITRWNARIRLPFSLITQNGPVTLQTREEVAQNFDYYLVAMDAMQADLIVREKVGFEPCHDGTVIATYHSHFLRHGTRIRAPYTASALLHPDDGLWRMSSILNALGHHHWTGKHPNPSGEEEQ